MNSIYDKCIQKMYTKILLKMAQGITMSRLCTVHVQSVQSYLRLRSASGMGQINFMFNGCRKLKKKNKIFFNFFN